MYKLVFYRAPISKVVGYLPPNIPRILINRTIVHPKHSVDENTTTNTTTSTGGPNTAEKDFRDGYVFDAYLLGNCDDVTRVLGKLLFPAPSTTNQNTRHPTEKEMMTTTSPKTTIGRLLATLPDDDEEFSSRDWKAATNVPFDRVFLFPGAQTTPCNNNNNNNSTMTTTLNDVTYNNNNNNSKHSDDITNKYKTFEEPLYREVVYCDGCGERIVGTIQKCVTCFDYDLCSKCFPKQSETHYNGKHHFVPEKSSPI